MKGPVLEDQPAPGRGGNGHGWTEAERLEALAGYHILDTPPEPVFDDLVQLTSQVCRTPMALITLVDEQRQWFKATTGVALRETHRDASVCATAMLHDGPFVVPDLSADLRFADNPLVTGEPFLRFYAGMPLLGEEQLPLGTLCVLAPEPRPDGLTDAQVFALRTLAGQVMSQLELRRMEQLKRVTDEQLRFMGDATSLIGVWNWDIRNDLVHADRRFAELFSVNPRRAMRGAPIARFMQAIHPDDRDMVAERIGAAVDGAGDFTAEYRIIQADGTIHWVLARGRCERDEHGNPARFPGVAIDITERRQEEERHREVDSIRRLALEAGPFGTWAYTPATGELTWDALCRRLFGAAQDAELSYEMFLASLHPDDRDACADAVRRAVDPDGTLELAIQFRAVDPAQGAAIRWIDSRGRVFGHRDGSRLIGTVRDVTESKQIEQTLKKAEADLRVAVDLARLGSWDHDLVTGERRWDERCREIVGLGADHQGRLDFYPLMHPADRPRVMEKVRQAMRAEGGTDIEVEYRLTHRIDGRERWIASRGKAFFEQDRCVRLAGVIQDITERKRHEEHLRLLVNELNHRVKNSLAVVQSIAAQTFQGHADPARAVADFIGRLQALAHAHDTLTREHWEGASLKDVVTRSLFAHATAERVSANGPHVLLPPELSLSVALAIHELATNAVKYGALANEAGRIVVEWSIDEVEGGRRLHLVWREEGGPPVRYPTRRGFGLRLLEYGLAAELGGKVSVTFARTGVRYVIDAPFPGMDNKGGGVGRGGSEARSGDRG